MATKTKSKKKRKPDDEWFDPAEAGQTGLEWLKAEPGSVTRIKLMAKPHREYCSYVKLNKIGFVQTLTEYKIDDNGRYREITPGLDQELTGEPPTPRYIVPVIVYDVKSDGTLPKKTAIEDLDYKFKLWSMSFATYERLYKQFVQWGPKLLDHDLLLNGVKKGDFVFFDDISVAPEALCMNEEIEDKVDGDWVSYKYRENFGEKVGKLLTEKELQALADGKSGD